MGWYNRPSLSQRWVGADGEQIIWKNGLVVLSQGWLSLPYLCGRAASPAYVGRALEMS